MTGCGRVGFQLLSRCPLVDEAFVEIFCNITLRFLKCFYGIILHVMVNAEYLNSSVFVT